MNFKYLFLILFIEVTCLQVPLRIVAQKRTSFTLNDFSKATILTGEEVGLNTPLKNPYEIILIDSLLLVKNFQTNPAVDVFNLNTGKLISSFCKLGRGPGELITPFCIQYIKEKNEIMIQDAVDKKVVFFDLDLILNDAPTKFTRVVRLDEKVLVRKLMQLKGGNFFCDLIGDKDGYMNCLIDSTGKFVRYLGNYPVTDFKFDFRTGSNIFPTNIGGSSSNVIVSYRNTDRIDVYNLDDDQKVFITGPYFKKPHVSEGLNGVTLTGKNKEAYNIPCAGDKYFMIPYRGKEYEYPFTAADHIFCIDYSGNCLSRYTVSPSVTEIAVDWDKRIIFSINMDKEPTLFKYTF